jgi:opacity protein-like surface antigen
MKLRIVSLVALILAFFTASASAQTSGGLKGGVGFASISAENEEITEFFTDSRTGFIVGGFVDVPVSDRFTFVIEGLYSQKGAKSTFSEQGFSVNSTAKVDYIEIPILANFPFNRTARVHPFVYGGVAPAFKVSAKMVSEFGTEEDEEDLDDEIESMDLGLVFGGGVRFGLFAIEARYNLGLMNLNTESDNDGSIKSRQIAILGSFYFR